MPLLHRQPFLPLPPPPDLDPNEEVFLCQFTNEIFREYETFFQRTVLCNSLVWSCEYTNRGGMTYQEAVEMEQRCKQKLVAFPDALQYPVVLFAHRLHHASVTHLAQDTYSYFRDRYVERELVGVDCHDSRGVYQRFGEIIQVMPDNVEEGSPSCTSSPPPLVSMGKQNRGKSPRSSSGHSAQQRSGGEATRKSAFHSPGNQVEWPRIGRASTTDPNDLKYKVRLIDQHLPPTMVVKHTELVRRDGHLRKDLLEMFLRKRFSRANGIGPLAVRNPVLNGLHVDSPPAYRYQHITSLPFQKGSPAALAYADAQLKEMDGHQGLAYHGSKSQSSSPLPSDHPILVPGKRRSSESMPVSDNRDPSGKKRKLPAAAGSSTYAEMMRHSRHYSPRGSGGGTGAGASGQRELVWHHHENTASTFHASQNDPQRQFYPSTQGSSSTGSGNGSVVGGARTDAHGAGHRRAHSQPQAQASLAHSTSSAFRHVKSATAGPSLSKPTMTQEQMVATERLLREREREQRLHQERLEQKHREKQELERVRLEKQREAERKRAEQLARIEWKRPRDDLLCDDLKPLPRAVPLSSRLPAHLVGDAMLLCEFLSSFGRLFSSVDFHEDMEEITFSTVEDALCSYDVEGNLLTICQFLLGAAFQAQEMLEADENHDRTAAAGSAAAANAQTGEGIADGNATKAAKWCLQHHGIRLRDHEITSSTVCEMLRLHLLAVGGHCLGSGYIHRSPTSNWQRGGGMVPLDDACVALRADNPSIIRRLQCSSVAELTPDERCTILTTLCQHLTTTLVIRDCVDESFGASRRAKQAWKDSLATLERLKRSEAVVVTPLSASTGTGSTTQGTVSTASTDESVIKKESSPGKDEGRSGAGVEQSDTNTVEDVDMDTGDAAAAADPSQAVSSGDSPSAVETMAEPSSPTDSDGPAVSTPTPAETGATAAADQAPSLKAETASAEGSAADYKSPKPSADATSSEADDERVRAVFREHIAEQEVRLRQLQGEVSGHSACVRTQPLGRDRYFRKYWVFQSQPGLFVETDFRTLSDLVDVKSGDPQQDSPVASTQITPVKGKLTGAKQAEESPVAADSQVVSLATGLSSLNAAPAPLGKTDQTSLLYRAVLSALTDLPLLPTTPGFDEDSKSVPNYELLAAGLQAAANSSSSSWLVYQSLAEFEKLLVSLNPRGFRERVLADTFRQKRSVIIESLEKCAEQNSSEDADEEAEVAEPPLAGPVSVARGLEEEIRETIASLEDRLWNGCMGTIHVESRAAWREKLLQQPAQGQEGKVDDGDAELLSDVSKAIREDHDYTSKKAEPTSMDATPSAYAVDEGEIPANVAELAQAILTVESGIDSRFLKCPLSSTHRKGENKAEQTANNRRKVTVLDLWRRAVVESHTLSQIALNLQALTASLRWERSVLNARCRTCRRKTDGENMLLCDYCNGGYHLYCLKPPLTTVPEDDWFCAHCRPSHRSRKDESASAGTATAAIAATTTTGIAAAGAGAPGSVLSMPEEKTAPLDPASTLTDASVPPSTTSTPRDGVCSVSDTAATASSSCVEVPATSSPASSLPAPVGVASGKATSVSAPPVGEDNIDRDICFVCRDGGELLLCDTCPRCYHLYCTNPLLSKIPEGDWICQVCAADQPASAGLGKSKSVAKKSKTATTPLSKAKAAAAPSSGPAVSSAKSTRRKGKRGSSSQFGDLGDEGFDYSSMSAAEHRRPTESRGGTLAKQLKMCESLWRELKNHSEAGLFLEPVPADHVPDYHLIVKRPMDLGTIKQNLKLGRYTSPAEFVSDVRQIFINCAEYNPTRTREARAGVKLSLFFETRLSELGLDAAPSP